jgi:hypothetical protein
MEIDTNSIVVQYRSSDTDSDISDLYGYVSVQLAAYKDRTLLYTTDDLGYTKFITDSKGYGVISVVDPLFSNEKQVRIFADSYSKYDIGLRLTISTEANDQHRSLVTILNVIDIPWLDLPFKFEGIPWYLKNGSFYVDSINSRVDNVKDLMMSLKESELKYLAAKAAYDAEIKGNVDLKLDIANPWEPATFRYVLTRILEFQTGTLIPAIEYAKVAELDLIQQRLQIVQDLFVVILQDYPKITIDEGEGMPYYK